MNRLLSPKSRRRLGPILALVASVTALVSLSQPWWTIDMLSIPVPVPTADGGLAMSPRGHWTHQVGVGQGVLALVLIGAATLLAAGAAARWNRPGAAMSIAGAGLLCWLPGQVAPVSLGGVLEGSVTPGAGAGLQALAVLLGLAATASFAYSVIAPDSPRRTGPRGAVTSEHGGGDGEPHPAERPIQSAG